MQKELKAEYPDLDIQLIGVNKVGKEADNEIATEGRDIPLLQDVDANDDGDSDLWGDWNATWRDVIILDSNNVKVGTYNLTAHDLAEPENYAALREMLVDAAIRSPSPWQNARDHLDVDNSTDVAPLDALLIINELSSAGSYQLPALPGNSSPPPYYDCNGDGSITPLDVLQVTNFLSENTPGATGEGEWSSYPGEAAIDLPRSKDMVRGPVASNVPSDDILSASCGFTANQPLVQHQRPRETNANSFADIDQVYAALEDRPNSVSLTAPTWPGVDLDEQLESWLRQMVLGR